MGAEGSSIGSNTYVRSIAAGERGNKRGKKTKHKVGKFVRNQWKLNSVFRGVNVNVIQPTTKEVAAMSAAVGVGLHREAFGMLAGQSSINDATVQRQLAAGCKCSLMPLKLRRSRLALTAATCSRATLARCRWWRVIVCLA